MPNRRSVMRACMRGTVLVILFLISAGCSTGPLTGMVYTHVRSPLTRDLHNTPVPKARPGDAKIIEIREPITGLGINARLDSNAIGEIAKANGLKVLYFADQETFSILGIWTSNKVILYGE
jgi:hypothetical protein